MIDDHRYAHPTPAPRRPRVALAHDWIVGYRGGEAVLEHIARVVAQHADIVGLYTLFHDPRALSQFPASPGGVAAIRPIIASRLSRLPGAGSLRRWLLPAYPLAVADLSRRLAADHRQQSIDLLISTSSAAIKGLKPPAGIAHICYCHAPPRYLWSIADEYAKGSAGTLRSLGLRLAGGPLRSWDARTTANATTLLANSTHTREQIARCYARDATIVFPPVDTDFYTPPDDHKPRRGWLYVGALEPYKRVDLAISSAALAKAQLTIAGTGSQLEHVQALARRARADGADIRVVGRVDNAELRALYRQSQVLIFPQIEDFGIVAVEAQACGTPVVARRAGGALDTVVHDRTGILFDEPTPQAIAEAADRCARLHNVQAACPANAERFGIESFEQHISTIIQQSLPAAHQSRPTS